MFRARQPPPRKIPTELQVPNAGASGLTPNAPFPARASPNKANLRILSTVQTSEALLSATPAPKRSRSHVPGMPTPGDARRGDSLRRTGTQ